MSLSWHGLTSGLAGCYAHDDFAIAILDLLATMQPTLHLHRPIAYLLRELLYTAPRSADIRRHFATLHGAAVLYALWPAHSSCPMNDHIIFSGTLASLEPIFWPDDSPPLLSLDDASPASFRPLRNTTNIAGAASTCRNVFLRLTFNLADAHSPSLEACLEQIVVFNSSAAPVTCPDISTAVFASHPSPVFRTSIHMLHSIRDPTLENDRPIGGDPHHVQGFSLNVRPSPANAFP